MRRYRKKELLDAISTLEKVNHRIILSFSRNAPIAKEELAQCQELAITVGNILETSKKPAETIVRILEDYCEDIYQLSLISTDVDKRRKLAKKIQKQLSMVENGIRSDLPDDKKEILFLPYKASMWDSLESVWKAASEDNDCQVFVVPIPYFEKNPDGSLGQMHDEKDLYPDYVPITSWLNYPISERKPDIIYIHNPYDQFNYVTSVHPDYYAVKLKKHTELLVYITYFVAIDNKVEEDFCRTPGVLCADKVIVQSEDVRKIYVQELHQLEKEHNCRGTLGNIESKVLALGNPKYDRVASINREEAELPGEWSRLILSLDGKRKKVILYNTTIDGMLRHNERMLEKIKDVLARFQKEKDVVLLWRPHPLLLTTIKSMLPDLAEKYQAVVQAYQREGFGIFDDSADMYQAIAASDAYFGDMSSVAELYKQTGKPMLIQSVFYEEEVSLAFEALAQVDEHIAYGSCAMFNGLFQVDLDSGDCTYMGIFPGEEEDRFRLHSKAWYADGNLYFTSDQAEYISVYCIKNRTFNVVSKEDPKVLEIGLQMGKPDPYMIPELEEDGFGTAFLFEAKSYRYFIKFKGKRVSKNPATWNACQYFRVNLHAPSNKRTTTQKRLTDAFGIPEYLEQCCFRFIGGKETFAADHKEYLRQIKTEQTIYRENLFFCLDDFLHELSGRSQISGSKATEHESCSAAGFGEFDSMDSFQNEFGLTLACCQHENRDEKKLASEMCQKDERSIGKRIHKKMMEISC